MHGVASAGMRELKIQHFTSRERRAGATQADARRGETAQVYPNQMSFSRFMTFVYA